MGRQSNTTFAQLWTFLWLPTTRDVLASDIAVSTIAADSLPNCVDGYKTALCAPLSLLLGECTRTVLAVEVAASLCDFKVQGKMYCNF